jgi:integrase
MPSAIKDPKVKGLYQRERENSPNVWAVIARQRGGKVVTHTIGSIEEFTVQDARRIAKQVLAQLALGNRPIDERRKQERIRLARKFTLEDAIKEYSETVEWKVKTKQDALSTLKRRFGDWYPLPIGNISKKDVQRRFIQIKKDVARIKKVRDEYREEHGIKTKSYINEIGLGEAKRAFRYLSAIFNSYVYDDIEDAKLLPNGNPCNILKKPQYKKTLQSRARNLNLRERSLLYDTLLISTYPDYPGSIKQDDADLIWLLIHTGLRLNEALSMKWDSVDFENEIFTVLNTKNHKNHTLPMTNATKDMFLRRYQNDQKKKFVFPSSVKSKQHLTASRTFARVCRETEFDFTAHDLRRTFASVAFSLGHDADAIGQALNHTQNSVTFLYIQRNHARIKDILISIQDGLFREPYDIQES